MSGPLPMFAATAVFGRRSSHASQSIVTATPVFSVNFSVFALNTSSSPATNLLGRTTRRLAPSSMLSCGGATSLTAKFCAPVQRGRNSVAPASAPAPSCSESRRVNLLMSLLSPLGHGPWRALSDDAARSPPGLRSHRAASRYASQPANTRARSCSSSDRGPRANSCSTERERAIRPLRAHMQAPVRGLPTVHVAFDHLHRTQRSRGAKAGPRAKDALHFGQRLNAACRSSHAHSVVRSHVWLQQGGTK